MNSVPVGYASDPGGYIKFLEVMVLLQLVIQPLEGIELIWQLKMKGGHM